MSARLRVLLFVGLVAAGATAVAQPDPTTERGVRPGLAYRVEGLDHVNLFNGTMTLNVPLGPTYPVNGSLSYSFIASYATNAWETGEHAVEVGSAGEDFYLVTEFYHYTYPSRHANAGFGWIVTLGKIFKRPEDEQLVYVAQDGGEHEFYSSLHGPGVGGPITTGVYYTKDGTYLRLKVSSIQYVLEFPNGQVHRFHPDGRLASMEDRFGNRVDVAYSKRIDVDGSSGNTALDNSDVWIVTDSAGREHRVYFRPGWSYIEEFWEGFNFNGYPKVPHQMVDKLVLAAEGGDEAVYTFQYDSATLPENLTLGSNGAPNLQHRTSRRCGMPIKRLDPFIPRYELVSILTSLQLPEGVTYSMITDRGDQSGCDLDSGNITRLVLPTGGRIDWTYQNYLLSKASGPTSGSSTRNAGVARRKTRLTNSDTAPVVQTTEYALGKLNEPAFWSDLYRLVTNKEGESTVINATKHYFNGCGTSWSTCVGGEYGLPITRTSSDGGAWLSTEFQVPDAGGSLQTRRRTYLRYEADTTLGTHMLFGNVNQRLAYERTVYADDGGRYADVAYTEFDGLGHYRKSVTDGNFERGNQRTTVTNYNPGAGTFGQPGFTIPATTSPWILTNYDYQRVTEESQTSETKLCFSDTTGVLTSRRVYKSYGASPASNDADLLIVLTYDNVGNLQTERSYGGEHSAAPAHSCGQTPPAGETYRIEHRYQYGALKQSWYANSSGNPLSFFIVDRDIDLHTGLISKERQFRTNPNGTDGVETTFAYDLLGRVTDATSAIRTVHYDYSLSPPKTTTTEKRADGTVLRQASVQYDGLGRTVLESRSMPGGGGATRSWEYNALGWPTSVTEWGASAPTVTTYDAFGRPVRIQPPDQPAENATTIAYTGASSVTRNAKVRTGGDATTFTLGNATTREDYDRQGRLIRVTEPQTGGGAGPVTEYVYDVGGRLTTVCANKTGTTCGQIRTFQYDNRGLLTYETHPESGTTNYGSYDAKGHLRRRYVATGSFDLRFTYDRAERLTDVDEGLPAGSTRPFKRFLFGTANSGTDLKNGQLLTAVRWNWLPNAWTVQVAENYGYADAEGRAVSRTTADYVCGPGVDCTAMTPADKKQHEFQQSFAYDELGATSTIHYPTCLTGGCTGISGRTVTNTYSNGFLTGVGWTGNTNTLSYHPSGSVNVVTHSNGVTDTQAVDPRVPSRPQRIVTGNIQKTGCVAPAFTALPQPKTIAGGGTATLTASATGDTASSITYQWYRGTAPDTSTPVGAGSSYAAQPAATTTYWVRASNGCGAVDSQSVTVTVCTAPQIGTGASNKSITRGQHAHLSVSGVTGSAPLSYQWYTVVGSVDIPIPGATGISVDVYPDQLTTYRIKVTNACGSDSDTAVVDVDDPLPAPANVQATYDLAIGKVRVTWTPLNGVSEYRIQRIRAGSLDIFSVSGSATSWEDTTAVAGNAYFYRVQARDTQLAYSELSDPDVASLRVFTDDTVSGSTAIRGVHISELREAVDAVRAAAGFPAAWSSYAPATGAVDDAHFTELRDRLNDARAAFALDVVAFTDVVAGTWPIKGSSIRELRDGVK